MPIGEGDFPGARKWWWAGWIPAGFFIFSSIMLCSLWWQYALTAEQASILETKITAEQVRLRLESWIAARTSVVEYVASQWQEKFHEKPDEYRRTASILVGLFPGFQALNWIDADWRITVTVPDLSNERALGADLHQHPARGVVEGLTLAETRPEVAGSSVIPLLQGGLGFAVYRQVENETGHGLGFVNGVFRIDTMVDACLGEEALRNRFRVRIIDDGGRVAYASEGGNGLVAFDDAIEVPVRVANQQWRLVMTRSSGAGFGPNIGVVTTLVGFGVVLAAVLALLMRMLILRQRALRDSESKYRLLVENQTDLVIKVDKEGRFQFVSPSYCETFRYSEEDLLGREFMPRVHEDDRVSTLEVMEALEHPPHTAYFEQKAMTDKGWRWFAWVDTAVFDGDGRINGVIGVGRDITERKKLEEQLMRSQKMEAVGLVAGGIAHDFNNLLQSIFGNLHFALAAVQEEGALRDDLLATQKNAESAAELIRQLLTFSRKQPIEAKPTHLNQVIDGMTSMLRRVISESISLEFFPDQSLGVVCVDAQQIEQLLLNLCANSRDAMPDGGMLAISTKSVTDRQEVLSLFPDDPPPDGLALLRVRDSGHGMDEEVSDRAFEPFFTTKGIDQGTGLGLSSVYGIVQQHGGLINIESAVGVGTTVTVCFPVVEEEVRVAEAGAPFSPVEGSGELILVAEDDPQILDLARKILIQAGYGVLCAGNGRDAFALFEDNWDRISLVLTDIIMPGMGGKELRDRIVEHRPGFPVLFSSGYGINEIDAQGELHSTVPIIHKPYDGPTLVNRIRTLIAGR